MEITIGDHRPTLVLENEDAGDAPYVECGPDGSVRLTFFDESDLTDLRDRLLEEYPLEEEQGEREHVWRASIHRLGRQTQSIVCMEECGELIQAISKRLRGKPDPEDNLAEEMADVTICLKLLQQMYGISDRKLDEWIERKTDRQQERNREENDKDKPKTGNGEQ